MWKSIGWSMVVVSLLVSLPSTAGADAWLTYRGAFKALDSSAGMYNGGLTYYPAGNGGAGSLFVSRGASGSGKEMHEIAMPPLVITTDVNALNMATVLGSYDLSLGANGLVWRSTDDKLYYSVGVTGSGQMKFRSINRDGSGESAQRMGPAWYEGGFANCQVPDAWAATHAAGKNILTIAAQRGIEFSTVDPWNAAINASLLWKYGTDPQMIGYNYGDAYNGIAWVEFGEVRDFVFCGSNLPGPNATFWFMRVSDFENRSQAVPQPYKIEPVQDRMFTTARSLSGLGYDATNRILYACEAAQNTETIVHAWEVTGGICGDCPAPPITDLAASNATCMSVRLAWTAPQDSSSADGKVAGYDVRFSTSPITEANWDSATQSVGEPTPSAPGQPEECVAGALAPDTVYYFAVQYQDTTGHTSSLSNVVILRTLVPKAPPAPVADLAASRVRSTRLLLTWSAVGNEGMVGRAAAYDIRHSVIPLTDANWPIATSVPQTLTPRTSGQPEGMEVSGLSPGTTYWFGIRAANDESTWSTLSNVVQVTTRPTPCWPPAGVTDLSAAGTDGLSADLSWTATADGNGDPASGYEIRCATSPISEASWDSATLVPNTLVPEASGSAEAFTVIGLQPATTYYFALKVKDELGAASDISNVAMHTTAAFGDLPVVTTVTIVEKAGVATTNYPVTLSMGFAPGDVADNVTVRAAGLVLPTQTDVKVRWPDSSVRHALVSFIIPQLQAGQTQLVEILAGGPNYTSGQVTKDQLLASDFEADLAMTVGGGRRTASAWQMLLGLAEPRYWIRGGICTEFVIEDLGTRYHDQLNVSYRVRVYPGASAIRVSTVVDNTFIDSRGNLTCDVELVLGRSSPQTVFSKTGVTHWHSARWHKVFWLGATPPKIEVRYNLPYWIKGGFLPSYDTSLVVPASTIASQYSSWSYTDHDIMDTAGLLTYFPITCPCPEVAPYPLWTSLYFCSMDRRMAEETVNYGDLSGSIPMHFRESDPARSFYGRPVSVDDRPTIWTNTVDDAFLQQYVALEDQFPPVISDVTTPMMKDLAHQPSLAYIPYLVTGDLYYLEEMHFWACYDLGASRADYRGGTQCWLVDQVRGNAWALRNVVDAAAMTPPDMPEKAYLDAKIANNIDRWNDIYIVPHLAGAFPTVRYYLTTGSMDTSLDPAHCSAAMATWQADYLTWSLVHAYQMGYPTLDLVHWAGQGLIDRFGDWPGWNRYRGTAYMFPALNKDAGDNPVPYATWADVANGFMDKIGPSHYDSESPGSYTFVSRGVMALVTDLPNGLDNWHWLDNALAAFKGGLSYDPRYAFIPAPHIAGDIDNDGHVDVVDLLYLVDTFGLVFGQAGYNPAADFNGDFGIDVVDLLTMVESWGV